MSERRRPQPVENYTNPFLVTLGAIFFMGFWLIASIWGFLAVVAVAAGIDLGVKTLLRACAPPDNPQQKT